MTSRWVGTLLAGAGASMALAAPVIGWRTGHLPEASRGLPQTSAFLLTGWLAVHARPDHRGSRRLLLVGLVMSAGFALGSGYSAYTVGNPSPPGWGWAAVLTLQGLDLAQAVTLLALLAVFPDGAYHRPYQRAAVLAALGYLAAVLGGQRAGSAEVVYPGIFIWGDQVTAVNPAAQPALRPVGELAFTGFQDGSLLLLGCGVALLALRFRHFGPVERRQTAWPLYGVLVTIVLGVVLGALSDWTRTLPDAVAYLLYALPALAVPASMAIGMVRHRLLDIDIVLRRSAVYGALWLLISAAYIAVALAFGIAVGARVPLALAVALTITATLVAAPARRRLGRLADRLVFGPRVSGYQLITQLGARLEATPDAEDVAATVATDVRTGLAAQWVKVVLEDAGGAVAGSAGDTAQTLPPVLQVPLVRGKVTVGAIECGPRREGRYSEADRQLLETLGRQAALAVHNSWLTVQLARRIDELTASRARIVQAEDAGRRRLERDIHDGVQQELVALLARLGLAANQLRRADPHAEASLAEVQRDAQRALLSLQDLARGIHPPLLTDRGLVEAVRARTGRLPMPVQITSRGLNGHRFPADVEGAAYFAVVEALGNVLKHAQASHAWVDLTLEQDRLQISVRDDGTGFDVDHTPRHGLLGLKDRVEALDGEMVLRSTPDQGTTISAAIPTGGHHHD